MTWSRQGRRRSREGKPELTPGFLRVVSCQALSQRRRPFVYPSTSVRVSEIRVPFYPAPFVCPRCQRGRRPRPLRPFSPEEKRCVPTFLREKSATSPLFPASPLFRPGEKRYVPTFPVPTFPSVGRKALRPHFSRPHFSVPSSLFRPHLSPHVLC